MKPTQLALATACIAAVVAGCAEQTPPAQNAAPPAAAPKPPVSSSLEAPTVSAPPIGERRDLTALFEQGTAGIRPDQRAEIEDMAFEYFHSRYDLALVSDGSDLGRARTRQFAQALVTAGLDPKRVFLTVGAPANGAVELIAFGQPEALDGIVQGGLQALADLGPTADQTLSTVPPIGRREVFSGAFAPNGAALTQQAHVAAIDAFVAEVVDSPYRVMVLAHTDSRGDAQHNEALGIERARAVAHRLQAAGLDSARVFIASAGEGHPLESNATSQGRAANRRFELIAFTDREALKGLVDAPRFAQALRLAQAAGSPEL